MQVYESDNIYMVDALPPPMFNEWQLPKFLLCGGFTEHLMFVFLWFSSGGTNGYVHTDQVDNLHCVFSGNKYFIMVHPKYLDKVETRSYFAVNKQESFKCDECLQNSY